MTIREKQEKIIAEFNSLDDWEEKYTLIIERGKELPEMPEGSKTEKNKITGCQSQVWIYAEFKDGKVYFYGDSDSAIVKGLVALILEVYSEHTPEEILAFPPEFITKIGMDSHLSPTRRNGLVAMLKQIQFYALAFKTLAGKIGSKRV